MTISDVFYWASGACAVAAVGVAGYALWGWHRRLTAYRAFDELDADIRADVAVYPRLKEMADDLAAEARSARKSHAESKRLADAAVRARNVQILCELRLKAADIDPAEILLGEVA
jgi:hypothetical protein